MPWTPPGTSIRRASTESQNFPTTSGAFQPQSYDVGNNEDDGGSDAFVTELSTDGSRLFYSTYFGGEGYDDVEGVDGHSDAPSVASPWTPRG